MGSCKECYHYEVCRMHYQQKCELTYETEKEVRHAMLEAEKGSPICEHFKDRSRIVEPPCKVGDTVYVLDSDNAIDEYFTKKKNIVEERHVQRIEIHKNNEFKIFDTPAYGEPPKKIGETMFFTKEAAEQALKHR